MTHANPKNNARIIAPTTHNIDDLPHYPDRSPAASATFACSVLGQTHPRVANRPSRPYVAISAALGASVVEAS